MAARSALASASVSPNGLTAEPALSSLPVATSRAWTAPSPLVNSIITRHRITLSPDCLPPAKAYHPQVLDGLRMVRSTVFESTSTRPSLRNMVRPSQRRSVYRIAFARVNFTDNPSEQPGQPPLQVVHQWLALGLAHRAPLLGRAAADAVLDGIDRGDPLDHLQRYGRLRSLVHGDEFTACMRETKRQPDPAGLGAPGQRLVGAVAVDLHHAGEAVAELRDDRLGVAAGQIVLRSSMTTVSIRGSGSYIQRESNPATAAPTKGTTQNIQSWPRYSPPANSAGPVLRAGLTDVLVTGIDTRWMSVSASPIGIPAKPLAAPFEVVPTMMSRKKNVITNSITTQAPRLYLARAEVAVAIGSDARHPARLA